MKTCYRNMHITISYRKEKKKKVVAKYSNLTQTPYISYHFLGCANYIHAFEVSLEHRKKKPT